MKTKTLFYMALMAVMMTLAACSQDDELMDAAPKATQIEFEITDGGFADVQTRAVEEGFRTKFTAGDVCGLYVVKSDGTFAAENVILTAEEGENGITWKVADGAISGAADGDKCFLYYPYQSGMKNKVDPSATDSDDAFFSNLINDWSVNLGQNDYNLYTWSDLMTAASEVKNEGGKLKVSFSLNHKMTLAIIEVPKTKYKFTNVPDGAEYIVPTLVDFSSLAKPLRMADGTYRFIVNTKNIEPAADCIKGTVPDGKKFTINLGPNLSDCAGGKCKRLKVGRGVTGTPIEKEHTLQVGDFLLKDGNLISTGTSLTDEQKANVAAIVFWSPAETTADGRTTPASLTDDKVMAAEHPNCNHGLAVAVKELSNAVMAWQVSAESVADFQGTDNFIHAYKGNFASIATTVKEDNINRILGYQNTQVLLAYNDYCYSTGKIGNTVKPAELLVGFANSNSAPTGSTGWFLPSPKELHMLCYKDVDNIYNAYGESNTDTREKVNTSLTAVNGESLDEYKCYWSSSEEKGYPTNAFYVVFKKAWVSCTLKNISVNARAVLAF